MKKFANRCKAVAVGLIGSGIAAVPAFAQPAWYEGVTFDTTAVTTLAGLALTALGVIWAVRKGIKLMNRS